MKDSITGQERFWRSVCRIMHGVDSDLNLVYPWDQFING